MVEIDRRSSSPEHHFYERWLQRTAQQNEAPADFFYSLEEGCSRESCSLTVQISAERGISWRATCLVFALVVLNRSAEHLRKPFFLLQRYSRDTQCTTWVLISCCLAHFISRRAKLNTAGAKTALREILLLEEIQG
jgi:hypothetical protein